MNVSFNYGIKNVVSNTENTFLLYVFCDCNVSNVDVTVGVLVHRFNPSHF